MFKRDVIVLLAIILFPGVLGGGVALYYNIRAKITFDLVLEVPFWKVHLAAVAALKDLGLPLTKHEKDKLKAEVESQFADGKEVWIGIRESAGSSSLIEVRVGIFGDESRSKKNY